MALCLPNEQMLQLTFPPLFQGGGGGGGGEGVLKTLAYSQQNLLAIAKSKLFFSLLPAVFLQYLILQLRIIVLLCCIIQG